MERIEFEDATLIKDAYVEIDGVEHTVIPAQTVGGTDLNKETFETLQDNMENATQRNITTDGEPVKCGYQIDGKDVWVARRSFSTSSSITDNSAGIDISDLAYSELIEISGISNYGVLLGDRQAITYTTNNLTLWFNNDAALSYEGKVMIYFTK